MMPIQERMSELQRLHGRLLDVRAQMETLASFETRTARQDARFKELRDEAEQLADDMDAARSVGAGQMDLPPGCLESGDGASIGPPRAPVNATGHASGAPQVPSLLPSADVLSALHGAAVQRRSIRSEAGAVTGVAASTATAEPPGALRAELLMSDTGADQLAQQLAGAPRRLRRIAEAARLPVETVSGMTSVEFPVFGSGDADTTDEGATKQEYDGVSPGSASPQMITIFTDTSRQNLLTVTNFESKLRTVLSAKVARREDVLVVSEVLDADTQTLDMDSPDPDALLEAAGMVAAGDVASAPNLALVHPEDLASIVGVDVGAGGRASPELTEFLPSIHGMSIYPTTAIDAGEILVGAWPAAARFVTGLAPTFLVDAVSGIKTNTVTILLEEAVTIAVDEPEGFVHLRPAG